MTKPETGAPGGHSIAAVERETQLGKDTLRVWERRYGFPQPLRDAAGERIYPTEQLDKLRVIKRLRDRGHRPAKIVNCTLAELHALSEAMPLSYAPLSEGEQPDLDAYLAFCRGHQVEDLRRALANELMRMGMQKFIVDVLAPLNRLVGEHWVRGTLAVFEEHLYTEVVQNLMRYAITTMRHPRSQLMARPRVMLSTLPQEAHGLGLLMAEAVFSMEGAHCVSLGLQTPSLEILRAAQAQRTDIIALSLSEAMNPRQALDALNELAEAAPEEMEIWIGGTCPAVQRASHARIHAVDLNNIGETLAQWRLRSGTPSQQQ